MLTTTVKVNKYGLVSIKVCCKWERGKEGEKEMKGSESKRGRIVRERKEGMGQRKGESGI